MSSEERVKILREQDPHMSATRMAAETGVSRQRVSQILIELGLPTTFKKETFCICGKKNPGVQKYCKACFSKTRLIDLMCEICQKTFQRSAKMHIRRTNNIKRDTLTKYSGNVFCSRHCFGVYIGKTFGFAAHPENAGQKKEI